MTSCDPQWLDGSTFTPLRYIVRKCILSEGSGHKGFILETKKAGLRSGNPLRRSSIRRTLRGWLYRLELERNGLAHVRLPCEVNIPGYRREKERKAQLSVAEVHGVTEHSVTAERGAGVSEGRVV